MTVSILQKLESKYDDHTLQLMRKATLLDPRYKGDLDAEHLDVIKSEFEVEMVTFWRDKILLYVSERRRKTNK